MKAVYSLGKDNVKNGIVAIGQSLIKKSDEVSNDLKDVGSITIYAEIKAEEIVNFDITKNYIARLESEENKSE